mgnify:CR=1 FL=1
MPFTPEELAIQAVRAAGLILLGIAAALSMAEMADGLQARAVAETPAEPAGLCLNAEEEPEPPAEEAPKYTEEELDLLARLLWREMGSSWIPDEEQIKTGSVVLNRMAHPAYPDTLREVIYQPGQYAPAMGGTLETAEPDQRTRDNARRLLEQGSVLPPDVIYQSGSIQGPVHSSYYDRVLRTTTYYCKGG